MSYLACVGGGIHFHPLHKGSAVGVVPYPRIPATRRAFRPKHTNRFRKLDASSAKAEAEVAVEEGSSSNVASIFGAARPLTAVERVLEGFSAPARHGACIAIVAAAAAAGYGGGTLLSKGGGRAASVGGAVALGVVGSVAAHFVNSSASQVAAVHLHNHVSSFPDPSSLSKEHVDAILHKYGISKQDQTFNEELRFLYDRYVTSILPPPNKDLQGNEVDAILHFKNVLGIDDPDAASVHMEIGRRIFRQRLEAGNRNAATEELRAFQKLVYVSNLVFGDASTFLLPWKRVFKVTDSQVEVAIRDNAKRLFLTKLYKIGDIDERKFIDLREAQLQFKLPDEVAAECFKSHVRRYIEQYVSTALAALNFRGRLRGSTAKVKEELDKILSVNDKLTILSKRIDILKLPPGIGPISLAGGEYVKDQREDLKNLYKAYLTEVISIGRLEDDKLQALNKLRDVLCLENQETTKIILETAVAMYRRRLSQAIKAGELDAAPSKAAFLQRLCDELHFDPERAREIHQELYKQKLKQCVTDGELSKDDAATLLRLRVMLCIPQETIDSIHLDICGKMFVKVLDEVLSRGVDGYDFKMEAKLHRVAQGLRLPLETVMGITTKEVREVMVGYCRNAMTAESIDASVKELKNMIVFNNFVLSRLLSVIKGEPTTVVSEPLMDRTKSIVEDSSDSRESAKKVESSEDLQAKTWMSNQEEITLKDKLTTKERMDLYQKYLLYCISSESIPKSASPPKFKHSEYLTLTQLGKVLALTPKDIEDVNKNLAEQAFRVRAAEILADEISKQKLESLDELYKKMGLTSERAQRAIKSIVWTKLAGPLQQSVDEGKLTVDKIKEFQEVNMDINNIVPKGVRVMLFEKIVRQIFSSGTGDFDEERIFQEIPKDLAIETSEAKAAAQAIAKEKISKCLVHLVSLLRQRSTSELVSFVNDLLACDKVVKAEPLAWPVREELADIFCVYLESNPPEEKLERVQYLLGFDDSTTSSLKESVKSNESMPKEEEEFVI